MKPSICRHLVLDFVRLYCYHIPLICGSFYTPCLDIVKLQHMQRPCTWFFVRLYCYKIPLILWQYLSTLSWYCETVAHTWSLYLILWEVSVFLDALFLKQLVLYTLYSILRNLSVSQACSQKRCWRGNICFLVSTANHPFPLHNPTFFIYRSGICYHLVLS